MRKAPPLGQRICFAVGDQVNDPAAPPMWVCPTETIHVDLLTGH